MNVEKMLGRFIGIGLAALTLYGLGRNKATSEHAMKYVRDHNSNKYSELLEKGTGKYTGFSCGTWQQAAKEVSDSLRIDSVARTNYAKGAQMVRDSIAKVNLNDTVKTVMKSVK